MYIYIINQSSEHAFPNWAPPPRLGGLHLPRNGLMHQGCPNHYQSVATPSLKGQRLRR